MRVHRLTDGAYERSGLAPDNVLDEPQNRRGPASLPLKPKAWNRLSVEIKGDKVTLELNDQAIYERTLEPTNRRAFGLFHYADATQARVRNVTYQGEWPRSLPARVAPLDRRSERSLHPKAVDLASISRIESVSRRSPSPTSAPGGPNGRSYFEKNAARILSLSWHHRIYSENSGDFRDRCI